jgi:hypothetical protein
MGQGAIALENGLCNFKQIFSKFKKPHKAKYPSFSAIKKAPNESLHSGLFGYLDF